MLVNDNSCTNDERAANVEKYILDQAVNAGVVKRIIKTTPKNPTKLNKTLAPWFDDTCREAKKDMASARRLYGKGDARSIVATKLFLRAC
jgi:hypothetical protein